MFKPWYLIPTKMAHDYAPLGMKIYSRLIAPAQEQPFEWRHLKFRNRYSIAGGVDKNAAMIDCWDRMGLGYIEIGTVTPKPQTPNPGTIMDRDLAMMALWNRMGFPNDGAEAVLKRLQAYKVHCPLFLNIGKNRDTKNENAADDYRRCAEILSPVADVFVINISSPNTKGLRDLQTAESIDPLVRAVKQFGKPVLLKLSPDMENAQMLALVRHCLSLDIDGWILTNTTTQQAGTQFRHEGGGVSGMPLRKRSQQCLSMVRAELGADQGDRLIVSVGGITDPGEAIHRLKLGADLIQTYSGLVFYGPHFFRDAVKLQKTDWPS